MTMGWSAWASLLAPCVASPARASVANSKIAASSAADSLIMANLRWLSKPGQDPTCESGSRPGYNLLKQLLNSGWTARSDRRGFLAPGDKARIEQARLGLAVAERLSLGVNHEASRGGQNRMAGCCVPLHGRPEARINVGHASGDFKKFQRRPGVGPARDLQLGKEGLRGRRSEERRVGTE